MELFKRFIPRLVTLAVVCLIAAVGYIKQEIIKTDVQADTTPTIIIDAGHGGLTNTIKV